MAAWCGGGLVWGVSWVLYGRGLGYSVCWLWRRVWCWRNVEYSEGRGVGCCVGREVGCGVEPPIRNLLFQDCVNIFS